MLKEENTMGPTLNTFQEIHDDMNNGDEETNVLDSIFDPSELVADEMNVSNQEEDETEGDNDFFFKMQFGDFLNRMSNFSFIPATKVDEITGNFLENSIRSKEIRKESLVKVLEDIPSLSDTEKERILQVSVEDDPYLKAQKDLSTDYKRETFIQENFHYIPPTQCILNKDEVALGADPDYVQYISIKESFKKLIQDKTFLKVCENENREKAHDGVVRDLHDGLAYKLNSFYKDAYSALLYSDAVEISNPLGWARGRHKIIQVYYTLCEIPRSQRSQIDRTQLVMVFREKLLKVYGYDEIFKCLIDDLKDLEQEGIEVIYPTRKIVKLGVLAYSGDNLESHGMGGFSTCFSSKDVCRFCHCQYSDLIDNIHDLSGEKIKEYWSIEEYDSICDRIEEENDSSSDSECDEYFSTETGEHNVTQQVNQHQRNSSDTEEQQLKTYGLTRRCAFNVLRNFHACISFPVDLMHDLFEGVIAQDLLGGIRILVEKRWFSLDDYNKTLRRFKYKSHEVNDKPQQVPKKGSKLPGKACSLWVHARNFPILMRHFVHDKNDEVLAFLLLLTEITSRLTALEFREHEILEVEKLIIEYLDRRHDLFERYPRFLGSPKPKHHFLTHYGQAIRFFGPLLAYWTARFESKHR